MLVPNHKPSSPCACACVNERRLGADIVGNHAGVVMADRTGRSATYQDAWGDHTSKRGAAAAV